MHNSLQRLFCDGFELGSSYESINVVFLVIVPVLYLTSTAFFFPCLHFPPPDPPFLSVCLSLTILAAVHCLDNIRKNGGRVKKRGRMRCSSTITIFGVSVLCELKEWRDTNQRKKQNLRLQVLSILDIRKNIYRQKTVEISSDFLWGRSPC